MLMLALTLWSGLFFCFAVYFLWGIRYNLDIFKGGIDMKTKSSNPLTKQQIIKTTPELVTNIKKIAHMKRSTINGLLNQMLKEYIQSHQELIEQYNQIYPEG